MEGAHISWNQESSVPFDVQQSDIILTSGFSIDGDDECRWRRAGLYRCSLHAHVCDWSPGGLREASWISCTSEALRGLMFARGTGRTIFWPHAKPISWSPCKANSCSPSQANPLVAMPS